MAVSSRTVRRALTSKLGFQEDRSASHPVFEFVRAGEVVAVTHISHGATGRDVGDAIIGLMARQLNVSAPLLRGAIGCSVSRESFLDGLLSGLGE